MTTRPVPKFSVGEEVILRSVVLPHLDTVEATVLSIHWGTFSAINQGTGWCYSMDVDFDVPSGYSRKVAIEPSLRKKYPKGDFSFDELINELNKELVT